jgi:hypothetical protein
VAEEGRAWLPFVTNSEVAITFTYPGHYRETLSIHDFLLAYNVNLGIDTRVHYVGLTKNPDSRPLLDRHAGRHRVEKLALRDSRDMLFLYNTFGVRCLAQSPTLHASFWVSNAFADDLEIKPEGLTLEKLFVAYFQPDCQGSIKSELTQLRNRVITLAEHHRVRRIDVEYEVDSRSEYYRLFSEAVAPSSRISFSVDTSAIADNRS